MSHVADNDSPHRPDPNPRRYPQSVGGNPRSRTSPRSKLSHTTRKGRRRAFLSAWRDPCRTRHTGNPVIRFPNYRRIPESRPLENSKTKKKSRCRTPVYRLRRLRLRVKGQRESVTICLRLSASSSLRRSQKRSRKQRKRISDF